LACSGNGRRDRRTQGFRLVDVGVTGRTLVLVVLAALAGTTVYQVLVAVDVIHPGDLPGEGPLGSEVVGLIAAAAVAASALLAVLLVPRGDRATALAAALAPAAAALMVAHFYVYDAYSLPTLIRHSERDFVPSSVVYVLAAIAVAVGLVSLLRRRLGLVLTAPCVLACGLTAWFSGFGH
jgi:hypothetical protein